MKIINGILSGFFEILLLPFRGMAPFWGLLAISVLTGIAMLFLFKITSNQGGIRKIRDKIKAHVLEIRLFKDDLGVMFRAQAKIMRYSLVYMRFALRPLIFILPVVILIMIQLDLRYGRSPLEPGDAAVVTARFSDGIEAVDLSATEGIAIETPAVRAKTRNEVSWRIRAREKGTQVLTLRVGEHRLEKEVRVGSDRVGRVESIRVAGNPLDNLTHPGESPLPKSSPLRSIEVHYQNADVPIFGIGLHWLVHFCVFSILAGFALKNVFGVQL